MKKIFVFSAFLLILGMFSVSAVSLQANFFGFGASTSEESEPVDQTSLSTSATTSDNILDDPSQWDCDQMNGEKNDKNSYLREAEVKNTEGELSRYNPEKSITLFLKNMDEAFSEQIEKFEDNSTGCDLSNPEGTSALEDHHISYPEDFGATQYLEFRKLDCAFEAMKKTGYFLCETEETISSEELMRCNTIFQEETLPRERDLLQRSLEVALRHVSELSVAWPLHQRMQCLNERLARERELLVETVQWLSKIQKAIPNLAQSK